jgi:hypothetical protein
MCAKLHNTDSTPGLGIRESRLFEKDLDDKIESLFVENVRVAKDSGFDP